MRLLVLLLSLPLIIAGCLAPAEHDEHDPHADTILNTGDIAPGGVARLTFGTQSVTMHCHPHPFMEMRVIIDAEAPSEAHVHIHDGETLDEYAFAPQEIRLAPHGVITYHDHGTLTHTATVKAVNATGPEETPPRQ